MTRTFLVDIDTGSETDFLSIAAELHDDIESQGYSVISVKPWAGKTLGALPSLLPPSPSPQT